jgi:hypothetical protein
VIGFVRWFDRLVAVGALRGRFVLLASGPAFGGDTIEGDGRNRVYWVSRTDIVAYLAFAPRGILHSTVTSESLTRQLPLTIRTLHSSQYDALQLNGVRPFPMQVAWDSALHQSRSSLPELMGRSSECAMAEVAINASESAKKFFIISPDLAHSC